MASRRARLQPSAGGGLRFGSGQQLATQTVGEDVDAVLRNLQPLHGVVLVLAVEEEDGVGRTEVAADFPEAEVEMVEAGREALAYALAAKALAVHLRPP